MRIQLLRLPRTRQRTTHGCAVPAARRGWTRKLVPVAETVSRAARAPLPHPPRRHPQPGQRLRPLHEWLTKYERALNDRLDRLDDYLEDLQTGDEVR
jgi:hypothetical protein